MNRTVTKNKSIIAMTNNGNYDGIVGTWISSKMDNSTFRSYLLGFEESLKNYYQYKKNKLRRRRSQR